MADRDGMKTGTRIEEKAAKRLDPAKMGIGLTGSPRPAEVEGQARTTNWCLCPWCHSPERCATGTEQDSWFRCGACGGAFRVG